nr:MerR family transcriptional regulator [Clostridia bacterium]
MRIKEAAARTSLTEKAIRLYEEKGLITPDITEINGRKFRDYSEETVKQLETIAKLRKSFFSVEQIADMLEAPESIPEVFDGYRNELHTQFDKLSTLIARADALEPTALTSPEVLASALHAESEEALKTPDGVSLLTEKAKSEPLPPVPDYRFRIWDEDAARDEREKAYEKYLRGYSRWDFFYDAELLFLKVWSKIWKPAVFAGLPLALFLYCLFTLPLVTEVDITLSGYEIHYNYDAEANISPEPYEEPIYSEPRTLNLKGTLYRYFTKPDYYEGEVNIDGFAPHTTLGQHNYTLEEELAYNNNFTIYFPEGETRAATVYGRRASELKRIGSSERIFTVYTSKELDDFIFRISEFGGTTPDGGTYFRSMHKWIVFPSSSAGEASAHYWASMIERSQK